MPNIYFDHVATTRPHEEVLEAMQPYLGKHFGNPASLHQGGQIVKQALEGARGDVAALLGCQAEELIFTANGSEANNLALKGAARANQKKGKHIITSAIEHYSVLHPLKSLSRNGFRVTYLPVDKYGLVCPKDVEKAIEPDTILVSIMHANNEVGTVEPIREIGAITRARGVLLHSDAVQTAGKLPLDVERLQVDLLSLAGHQFYGPKGSGALYVRQGVRILPLIEGGLQEEGRRAGTPDAAAIVGLGKAAQLAKAHQEEWSKHTRRLAEYLRSGLAERIEDIIFTGHPDLRLPGHLNICVKYIEGEGILLLLDMEGIAAASGSACISQALKGSYVLEAMGIEAGVARGSLLLSLGKDNTKEEVDYLLQVLPPIVERLRRMSPLGRDRNK